MNGHFLFGMHACPVYLGNLLLPFSALSTNVSTWRQLVTICYFLSFFSGEEFKNDSFYNKINRGRQFSIFIALPVNLSMIFLIQFLRNGFSTAFFIENVLRGKTKKKIIRKSWLQRLRLSQNALMRSLFALICYKKHWSEFRNISLIRSWAATIREISTACRTENVILALFLSHGPMWDNR